MIKGDSQTGHNFQMSTMKSRFLINHFTASEHIQHIGQRMHQIPHESNAVNGVSIILINWTSSMAEK